MSQPAAVAYVALVLLSALHCSDSSGLGVHAGNETRDGAVDASAPDASLRTEAPGDASTDRRQDAAFVPSQDALPDHGETPGEACDPLTCPDVDCTPLPGNWSFPLTAQPALRGGSGYNIVVRCGRVGIEYLVAIPSSTGNYYTEEHWYDIQTGELVGYQRTETAPDDEHVTCGEIPSEACAVTAHCCSGGPTHDWTWMCPLTLDGCTLEDVGVAFGTD